MPSVTYWTLTRLERAAAARALRASGSAGQRVSDRPKEETHGTAVRGRLPVL